MTWASELIAIGAEFSTDENGHRVITMIGVDASGEEVLRYTSADAQAPADIFCAAVRLIEDRLAFIRDIDRARSR